MSRVLITGAAGFVGAQLLRLLLSEGHEVSAIVRSGSNRWRLVDLEGDFNLIEGDLQALADLRPRLLDARPEICVHLAWSGWAGTAQADENLSSLQVGLDLLRVMPALSCGRFVAVGTCFEYDLSVERVMEQTPLRPRELYGVCKKALFEVGQQFSAMTGLSVVTPRVFNSYGPWDDARRLVPAIALAVLRGQPALVTAGEQVRDYLHVEDVASAIWRVAISDRTGPVNIASATPVTIADLAMRVGRLCGRPELVRLGAIPYRTGEPMRILGDDATLRALGWSPRFDLERGLAETVDWLSAREQLL